MAVPALPHGELRELFDGIWFVTGTVKMNAMMRFSRNMTVVREGDGLVLVNAVRLDEAGLATLDALGAVRHVIRVASFHGMDDGFYKERYGTKIWALEGTHYTRGFEMDPAKAYFEPDVRMGPDTKPPIADARLIRIETSTPPEGLLLLEREGGIVIPGDCLQNWGTVDPYFSFMAGLAMRAMGFIKPFNVGPGWYKGTKPDPAELKRLLDLDFEHVLPAHGAEVIGEAKEKFRPAIERLR